MPNRTFPYKLWKLIHSSEKNGLEWSPNGKDVVMEKKLFMKKCLGQPNKFKTKKLLSITKQFNVYGFKQLQHGQMDLYIIYTSPYFRRGQFELLSKFTRRIAPPGSTNRRGKKEKRRKAYECHRTVLGDISNVPVKTRAQPARNATKVRSVAALLDTATSSSSEQSENIRVSSSHNSSKDENWPPQTPSAQLRQQINTATASFVEEARDNFKSVLQDNVMKVLQLPTGLTSSSQSSESSFNLDVSNKPVKFPFPPRRDPQRVMLNGNCPPSPVYVQFNPNAFIASPWNHYLELSFDAVPFKHNISLSEIVEML
ncbi:Hypothetical predicted protein [Cloeon dipterum]|uniref:HSF-type DNA-binding domain-containing protein n=1 Tax=Cloeon dipterum TaxID=197152 RepID=A0A8S1D528_9INSE|nr:Hypothetical predicted protein [Cloeon dipterum]